MGRVSCLGEHGREGRTIQELSCAVIKFMSVQRCLQKLAYTGNELAGSVQVWMSLAVREAPRSSPVKLTQHRRRKIQSSWGYQKVVQLDYLLLPSTNHTIGGVVRLWAATVRPSQGAHRCVRTRRADGKSSHKRDWSSDASPETQHPIPLI